MFESSRAKGLVFTTIVVGNALIMVESSESRLIQFKVVKLSNY